MTDKPLEQILDDFMQQIAKESRIVEFHGQELYEEELDVLLSIARNICSSAFAYYLFRGNACVIKDRRVSALRINNAGLTAIPQQINKLMYLTHLELYCNRIRKIENLNNMPNLKRLYLKDNLIVKIENLENLPELQTIYLSKNRIRRIENLDNLPKLRELSLKNNWISIVENLDNLYQLEDIWLKYNLIKPNDSGLRELKRKGVNVYI